MAKIITSCQAETHFNWHLPRYPDKLNNYYIGTITDSMAHCAQITQAGQTARPKNVGLNFFKATYYTLTINLFKVGLGRVRLGGLD